MNVLFHAISNAEKESFRAIGPSRIEVMADEKKMTADAAKPATPEEPKTAHVDDDVVGKAYDGRIMRRLFRYLSPYTLQVCVSAVAIVLKAGSDVLGPYFVKVAVDNYFASTN